MRAMSIPFLGVKHREAGSFLTSGNSSSSAVHHGPWCSASTEKSKQWKLGQLLYAHAQKDAHRDANVVDPFLLSTVTEAISSSKRPEWSRLAPSFARSRANCPAPRA